MGLAVVVIGGGPGGYVAAIRAAQLGAKVTVVEDQGVGGACLLKGCIPTKALVASCEVFERVKRASEYGITISGEVRPDLTRILERKDQIVQRLGRGIQSLLKSHGIELITGRGVLLDAKTIQVTSAGGSSQRLQAAAVILATGSRPARLADFPFDARTIFTSDEAVELAETPRSLLIVGAGLIGCEFGFIYATLGTQVTVVEQLPRALSGMDAEVAGLIEREMARKGVRLVTGVRVEKVARATDGWTATLSTGDLIRVERILVATGRLLNTEGLGLEAAGIATGERGEVVVNEQMETKTPGIYAIGDIIGRKHLAHLASAQGKVAAQAITGHGGVYDETVVPAGIFTMPEIGTVGLTEEEARGRGLRVKTGRFAFRGLGKAHIAGDLAGFVKLVADAATDRVIGAHIVGAHAADLTHEAALGMRMGARAADLAETIHAHPTLSEAVMEAAEDTARRSIHTPKPS